MEWFLSPLQRYYSTKPSQNYPELLIRVHLNKLVVLFLNPEHWLAQAQIDKVEFVGAVSISGKRKRGAENLHRDSVICLVTAEGKTVDLRAGVSGKLIETNEILLTRPGNLAHSEGYFAIIQVSDKQLHQLNYHSTDATKSTQEA